MSVKEREQASRVPGVIEAAAWWQPFPSLLAGVASVGGVFGLIPFDSRRFSPDIDAVLLRADGTRLLLEFKQMRNRAAHELERGDETTQPRLFDPDAT
jgi:hypothetical protein